MADVRDALMLASGGVTARHAYSLDGGKPLSELGLARHSLFQEGRMLAPALGRSQTLPQVLENRILTKRAISAAEKRRPH